MQEVTVQECLDRYENGEVAIIYDGQVVAFVKEDNQNKKEIRKMEEKITITLKEYRELIELSIRAKVFAEYVKNSEYSISKKECAAFWGFEVQNE